MRRVVGIVGSMRRHGNTEVAVSAVLAGVPNAETELIRLSEWRIEQCRGCYEVHSRPGNPCAIQDDMATLLPKLLAADALVFGSPAYFGGVTGVLRTFLDRSGPLWGRLAGKPAAIVSLGADRFGGQELVAQDITVFCRSHRLPVVGWPLCLQTPAGDRAGSLSEDQEAMAAATEMGRALGAALQERGL